MGFNAKILVVAGALILAGAPAGADEITGHARAIDGDTVRIGERDLALLGIDAPEIDQTCRSRKGKVQRCGDLARQVLHRIVTGRPITCTTEGTDPDGVPRARCGIGPFDINETMVAEGWALAVPDYGVDYSRAETFAKARREGLWRGSFVKPWEWRAGKREPDPRP